MHTVLVPCGSQRLSTSRRFSGAHATPSSPSRPCLLVKATFDFLDTPQHQFGSSNSGRLQKLVRSQLQDWRTFRARLVEQAWTASLAESPEGAGVLHPPSGTIDLTAPRQGARAPAASAPSRRRNSSSGTKSLEANRPAHPTRSPAPHPPPQPPCTSTRWTGPAVRPSKPGPCQAQQAGREAQGPWQQSRCTSTGAGYSAQLTAGGWAHRLAMPELGCLLVARDTGPADAATAGQPGRQDSAFFHRAVVLITSHDPVRGSVGLVLNKASPLRVRDLTVTAAVQGFMSVFSEHTLQLGGPVHLDHVTLLHRFRGLQGAACVADGLYTGGLPAAVQLVQAGLALPSDFVLALGVSGWRPVQLQRELMAGCWDIVAAAPDLVLPPGPLTASGPAGTGGSSGTGSGSRAGAAAGADWLQHAGEAPQRLPPALAAAALAEQRGGTAPGRQRKGQGRRLDTSTPALRPPPQPRPASGTPASAPPYCLWSHIRGVAQLQ